MKVITIHNISLQFDGDVKTIGLDREQARVAIDIVNDILHQNPFGINAQILTDASSMSVESETLE